MRTAVLLLPVHRGIHLCRVVVLPRTENHHPPGIFLYLRNTVDRNGSFITRPGSNNKTGGRRRERNQRAIDEGDPQDRRGRPNGGALFVIKQSVMGSSPFFLYVRFIGISQQQCVIFTYVLE